MTNFLSSPNFQVLDANGNPVSGAKATFYETGTSTERNTYQENALSTPHANPVIADASGRFAAIYLDPQYTYKLVVTTSADVTLFTIDPINSKGNVDLDGSRLILDADADTYIEAATDDTLVIVVGGTERLRIAQGVITYNSKLRRTKWFPVADMVTPGTNGPAEAQVVESSNGQSYNVRDLDGSSDEFLQFQWSPPDRWDEGTVTYQAVWTTAATDTDGVAIALQAVAISDNEAIDASWGTAIIVQDDAQGAASELLVTAESDALTIAGSPASGDLVFFQLYRDVSDTNDDMAEDLRLIGVRLFYNINAAQDA